MKYFRIAGIVFILTLCLGLILALGIMKVHSNLQQRQARTGLNLIVTNDLPGLEGFEIVETVSVDFSETDFSMGCYYARDNLIISTSLPESEAIDVYARRMQSLGWKQTELFSQTIILYHYGENAYAVVTYGEPGPVLHNAVNYNELIKTFPKIIFVRIDYMLPDRDNC